MKLYLDVSWDQVLHELTPNPGDYYIKNNIKYVWAKAYGQFSSEQGLINNHKKHKHTLIKPIKEIELPKFVYAITFPLFQTDKIKAGSIGDAVTLRSRMRGYRSSYPYPSEIIIPAAIDVSNCNETAKYHATKISKNFSKTGKFSHHEWYNFSIKEVKEIFKKYVERNNNEVAI